MTQVFLSWSGTTSKGLAEAFREWLPSVLQFVRPYFTPSDIEKGTKWANEISERLSACDVGIVCLTRENLSQPWILFEAGALSKRVEASRLCVVLFGIENSDISGPLSGFQSTVFSKDEIRKLVKTINDSSEHQKLDDITLGKVFEKWWPDLEERAAALLSSSGTEQKTRLRSDREILEEILDLSRSLAKPTPTVSGRISPQAIVDLRNAIETLRSIRTFAASASIAQFNEIDTELANAIEHIERATSHIQRRAPITFSELIKVHAPRPGTVTWEGTVDNE